jgi:flagellar hook assembly protein FlgD
VLNKDGILDIYIYDIKGALIYKREINAHTGYNTYTWNGISDFGDTSGTGTYFYRMVDQIETRVLGTAKLTIINK